MPSKRTNDSVEKILQDLNREQEAKGIRDRITDTNVDEILRSIPRSTAPVDDITATLGPIEDADMPKVEVSGDLEDPEARFSTQAINELLADLPIFQNQEAAKAARMTPAAGKAAAPARPAAPRQEPAPRPARSTAPKPEPQPAPVQPDEPAAEAAQHDAGQTDAGQSARQGRTGTVDTTRTGIIKNFLRQMGSDNTDNTTQLSQRKNQFQRFFEESIAVVPGKNGKLPHEKKRRKGLFGRSGDTGELTEEFVPINVSLRGRRAEEPAPQPEEEPAAAAAEPADTAPDDTPAEEPRARKRGLFAGLFARRTEEDTGTLYEEEEPAPAAPEKEPAPPAEEAAPAPEPAPESAPEKYVYRSKYAGSRRVHSNSMTDTFSSLGLFHTGEPDHRASHLQEEEPRPQAERRADPAPTEESPAPPRKKRDTVEFTPGHTSHQLPQQPPEQEAPANEPVGEPVMTSSDTLTTGFTIKMDRVEEQEDTHDFVASLGARAPRQQPRPAAPAPREEPSAPADAREDTDPTGQVRLGLKPQPAESTGDFALDFLDNQPEQRPDTAQFVKGIAQTLNNIPEQEPDTGRYAEAARRLTGQEPEEGGEPDPGHHGRTRLAGTPEDEREPEPEGPFTEEHGHRKLDYETAEDAPRVRQELDRQVLMRMVNAVVSAVGALVLLYLGIGADGGLLPLPAMLAPAAATGETAAALAAAGATAAPLLGVMLVLMLAVCAVNWQTMLFGLAGLARTPTADSMAALAGVGGVVQLAAFLVQPGWYRAGALCLLAGPAALVLCGNAVGKLMDARTTRANFELVSAGVDHAVAYRLRDAGVVRTVTRGLGEPKPSLLVSRPTVLLKHFLAGSAARRTSDKNQQQFSWVLGACGLISFLFTLLYRRDAGMAFTALAAVLCLGAPLAGTLISALPAQKMQRSAARVGAVIPGWKDIRQLGRINVIQITARDLFPAGCVTLAGIRPVGKERIDQAIIYAASILAEGSPTLRDVFLGMIGDNRKLLSQVDDLKSVYGKGYLGWIGGNRVLVGNRALMQDYGIKIPSLEFEQRHSVNQRRVVYLAASGNLMAMFLVGYQRDPDTAAVLEGLRQAGMSMIVDCDDFNCDVHLIEAVYGLPSGSVKVLSAEERQALAPATAWLPESEGNMLHLGSFASFVGGLEAAAGAAEGEYRAGVVLTASVLISCVMAVIMSLAGGIASLPTVAVVLYQLAWAVLALIFPMTRRY